MEMKVHPLQGDPETTWKECLAFLRMAADAINRAADGAESKTWEYFFDQIQRGGNYLREAGFKADLVMLLNERDGAQ